MLETDATSSQTSLLAQQLGRPIWSWSGLNGVPKLGKMALSGSNAPHTSNKVLAGNKTTLVPRPNQYLDSRLGKFYTQHRLGYHSSALQREGIFLNRKVTSGYPSTAGTPASTSQATAICGVGMQLYCVR